MLERIGNLQRIPTEEWTIENSKQKYELYVDYSYARSGKVNFVRISNSYESNKDKPIHEIKIKGEQGIVGRTLRGLVSALESIESTNKRSESEMKQALENWRKEGKIVVPTLSKPYSREDLRNFGLEKSLPEYDLNVRWSRFPDNDIIFIIKGIEKEATEPPFKIEIENDGDFVSVTKENFRPLIEELHLISQLPS